MRLKEHFDPTFTTGLALRDKQIQQGYRPIIVVHPYSFAQTSRKAATQR